MRKKIKIGILRETKNPPDRRVAITPSQAAEIQRRFSNVDVYIQPSELRCYKDEEYQYLDLKMKENLDHCDILIGVKEVEKSALIPGKTYLFFSHTAKKQPYNRGLLQEMLKKRIRMIDYEYLTESNGNRVVAFGRWAGIVGAYKALRARGLRTDNFQLKPAHECHDMDELFAGLKKVKLKPVKILVTGEGRVASGALETLSNLNIRKVTAREFLRQTFDEPVICQVGPQDYVEQKEGKAFDFNHFMKHPDEYTSTFLPFTKVTDIFIACHFWDPSSPKFMTIEDMQVSDFKMSVIADVSCDIDGPIPSTIRPSTIADPFYGFDPVSGKEVKPFGKHRHITVMAVDNLPGELPRNASSDFGNALIEKVYPYLFGEDQEGMIERATITRHGKLTERFTYLKDFADGRGVS